MQYRRVDNSTWTTISSVTSPSNITGLTAGTQYEFQLKAIGDGSAYSDSNWSGSQTVWTLCNQPTGVSAIAQSSSSIQINWTASTGAASYIIECSADGSTDWDTVGTPTSNSYTNSGLNETTGYYYRVTAVNPSGNSVVSATVNVTTPTALTSIATSTNSPVRGTQITTTLFPGGATATYQWYRGANSGNVTTAISGATSASYTPTTSDIGYYLKVVATGTGNYAGAVNYTLTNAVTALTTITVTNLNANGAGSLRQAIVDIATGGTILFAGNLTGGTISIAGTELAISKSLTIDASNLYNVTTQTPGITISGNNSSRIFNISGSSTNVSLIALTITGGGISNDSGMLAITGSTISGNSAYSGGGIYNSAGTLTVTDSIISGNSASNYGGGICNYSYGQLTITNSTISGNSASKTGGGIDNTGMLTIANSTISGNLASSVGGGIWNSGTVTLYNTIVAKNSTDIYQNGGTVIGSNNLTGNGTNSGLTNGINGNIVGSVATPIDTRFVKIPAVINAGNTGLNYNPANWDLRLQVTSPAIDTGNNARAKYNDGSDILYDIVGNNRIIGVIVDIGAYEYVIVVTVLPAPVLNTPTGISASGLSLSWNAIANAGGYALQYRAVGAGSWISVTGTIASPQAITGLIAGTQYQFRVMAIGNGVTYIDSDWSNIQTAWTDDYVAVSTPYPAMMTQEGCSIYLQAVDIFGENLTYWWDLSGTGNGAFVQLNKSFWVNVDTLRFTAGEYTIRMFAKNGRGTQSEPVSIALSVVAPPATFNVAKTTLLNDQIVMLDIDGYFPGGRVPQSWTVNWGDSSGSSVYTAATTFVKAIYYYPQNTSDTTYPITLTIVNSYGTTETYFLGTHVVPGSVAPVESALPMLLSEGELFTPRHEGTEVLGENLFVANSITETIAGYSVVSWFDPAFALVAQTGWDSFIRFSLNEEKLLPASSNRLIDASLTDWFGDFIADEVADESIVLESINRQLLRTSESKSDRFDTQFDYFDTLFEEELIEYAGY